MDLNKLQITIRSTLECLEKYKEQHSCIIAAATFIDTLKSISPDLKPYPLTVEATILGEHQTKQFKTSKSYSGDKRIIGPRNFKSTKDLWAGHLITIIPNIFNKTLLVDLTIHQANKMQNNIVLNPVTFPVTKNFIKINERVGIQNNNYYIIYRPYPKDKTFKSSPLWRDLKYRKQISTEILSNINILLSRG